MTDTGNKTFSRILGNLDDSIKVLESKKKKKKKRGKRDASSGKKAK